MQDADIYVKTDAGRDEIKSRQLGLTMAIRAILLMIDGQRSVAAMRTIIAGSKAPPDVLDSLVAQGLIEPVASTAVAQPMSIATPRAREATPPRAIDAPPPVSSPPVGSAPSASSPSFRYDGPLDLTLPTIHGPDETVAKSPTTPGLPPANGVPAAPPIDRYEHLYGMMNEIVRDFLSPTRRYFFQLKIERCGTPEALLELLHDLQTALAKSKGEAFASEVISRLRNAAS